MAAGKKPKPNDDQETKILQGRKFSLSEAIGRSGRGTLKGASPVSPSVQLLLGIKNILEAELIDQEGSLRRTILTQLEANPPLLAQYHGKPRAALLKYLATVLNSESRLQQLVRDTDARWGRDYSERPHFEKAGLPADQDDPYTNANVQLQLKQLFDQLSV